MERDFVDVLEQRQQQPEIPGVQRRMRLAAHVHHAAQKRVLGVFGMQRLDLRVLGFGQIVNVVASDGLVEEWQAQRQHQQGDKDQIAAQEIKIAGHVAYALVRAAFTLV